VADRSFSGAFALPSPLPLDDLQLARLEQLERVVGPGRFLGWGWEGTSRDCFVDVMGLEAPLRFTGAGLHAAIGAAIRALAPTAGREGA
jgi:hypothetical protein